ncbi:MAG: nicotinamide riboside transporter PnuC [Saprospiraceae bacterium]
MESIWPKVVVAAQAMTITEIIAVVTGILYVLLVVKENRWCWVFGIISSAIYISISIDFKLYADAFLYSYYVFAGCYGWYTWKDQQKGEDLAISTWTLPQHLKGIALALVLSWSLYGGLKYFTDASLPFLDAHTTVFSFLATYMVTQKLLHNWVYWIVIDLVYIALYANRTLYLTSGMMIVYTLVAIIGWLEWQKAYRRQRSSNAMD